MTFPNLATFTSITAMSLAGTYSEDATAESKQIDVSAEVADDIVHRGARTSRTQYRLKIDVATNDDDIVDRAVFAKDTFELTATYIAD